MDKKSALNASPRKTPPTPLFYRLVNFSPFFIFRKLICHITLLHFFSTLCVFCRIIVSVVFILLFHFFCSFLKRNFLFIAHSFFAIFTFYPLMSLKFLSFSHLVLFHTVPVYSFLSITQDDNIFYTFHFHFHFLSLFFWLIRTELYEVSSKTNATDLLKTKRFKLESYFLQHKVSLIFR